jgi:hypothetical protein
MKFGRQSHIYNHSKMVEVQTSEVDAIPALVSLAEQWVKIRKH